jgi:hypothetical protein
MPKILTMSLSTKYLAESKLTHYLASNRVKVSIWNFALSSTGKKMVAG